jgi:thioredoxin family protein
MKFQRRVVARTALLFVIAIVSSYCAGQGPLQSTKPAAVFPPLEQWKAAVISGNVAILQAFYSSNPPAQVATAAGASSVTSEVAFWTGLKARRMKLNVIESQSSQTGIQQVVFQAEVHTNAGPGGQTLYVTEGQLWQKQGEQWRLAGTKRSDATKLQQPVSTSKVIYAPGVDAHAEIKQALRLAAKGHKRVLVVFGANWCYDCHVLDLAFHRPDVASVLQQNFEVVHVDVGEGDKNQELMAEYQVPMKRGIPAIAVLDSDGKLLYSQKGGEFEKARALAPEDLLAFLNKWKPAA